MTSAEIDIVGKLVEAAWRRQEFLVAALLLELRRVTEREKRACSSSSRTEK